MAMAQRAKSPVPPVVREAYDRGWTPIPQNVDKKGTPFKWKKYQKTRPTWSDIKRWASEYPKHAWAIVTGQPGGNIVLDFDGPEGIKTMKALGLKPHIRTPSGGAHVWVEAPEYLIKGKSRLLPGMDLKAHGGLATIHGRRGGKTYKRTNRKEPYRLPELKPKLRKLIESRRVKKEDRQPIELPKDFQDFTEGSKLLGEALSRAEAGSRNEIGFWLAQQIRDERQSRAEAWKSMSLYANLVADLGDPPYTQQEAYNSLLSAFSQPPRLPRLLLLEDGIIRLENVPMERVEWVWNPWLAKGKLSLLDGGKGRLKSTLVYSLVACTTRGGKKRFPGEPKSIAEDRKPMGCVIFTNEEEAGDTIKPKLLAAGADLKLVRIIERRDPETGRLRPIKIPDDLGYIESQLTKIQKEIGTPIGLVTIDPIMGYLSDRIHYGNDPQVRDALIPLTDMLRRFKVAGLIVRHLNKTISQDAEHRGGGSVSFPNVARVHLLAEWHPEHPGMGVLAQIHNNLARKPQARTYQSVEKTVESDGVEVETHYAKWGKALDGITANDLLKKPDSRKEDPRRRQYEDWLEEVLKDGRWHKVKTLQKEFKAAGFSASGWRYLAETVAPDMGVKRTRSHRLKGKGTAYWMWRLPSASKEVKADVQA